MVPQGKLLSLNVGLPRNVEWNGRTVRTAIWKFPVEGRRVVRKLNVDGDAQADLGGHGGEQRAVFVYQIESYRHWEEFLGRDDFSFGQFGENFTVEGLADDEVCVGDRYQIGSAVFEVSQPRVTCYRLGMRMNEPRMPALVVSHRRPGFYFRVVQEGEVGAGDDIVKIASGPEQMTVADVDGLLYLPGHSRDALEKALRIPALSTGWQSSFQTMLEQDAVGTDAGNPGLATEARAPAWSGFRRMAVAKKRKESSSISSFELVPVDGEALPLALPGQFIVLRLQVDAEKPAIVRSYSLSDGPNAKHFRISVKNEEHGPGSAYLSNCVEQGEVLEVSAPRGTFTLRQGDEPVVLLSAGVGATPVLSMLHALVAERTKRHVWWVYGARDSENHPFASEARSLLDRIPHGREYVAYSNPLAHDTADGIGRIDVASLEAIGVPRDGSFYVCGPPTFMEGMRAGLRVWGVPDERIRTELFAAVGGVTPGIAHAAQPPHLPSGPPGSGPAVSFARSGITAHWDSKFGSLLELAEACDVPVRWSCRTGVCHNCMSGLVGGTVASNPEPLDMPSAGNVLICCAQPSTDVILDL